MHLKVVRAFVESVLRYGLPAEYNAVIVKVRICLPIDHEAQADCALD